MKIFKTILLIAIINFFVLPLYADSWGNPKYVPSELLVKFRPNAKKQMSKSANNLCWRLTARAIETYKMNDIVRLKLPKNASVMGSIREAYRNPGVLYAEPNQYIYATAIPNDTFWQNPIYRVSQSPRKEIHAPEAWDIITGSDKLIIAVIDTGVDYSHEDLLDNMWVNKREVYNRIDDDGNGYIDDYRGWNFIYNNLDPMDDSRNGHGTICAGIIGAVGNNRKGLAGVCWKVKIMPLKVLDKGGGGGTIAEAIRAIEYAVHNGARIMNFSWVFFNYSRAIQDTLDTANKAGVLAVCSAGNFGTNNDISPLYPCSYNLPNIISVAASDGNNLFVSQNWSSCYGARSVHLAAPFASGLCTASRSAPSYYGYARIQGTSASAPHVSGVCGLIWAQNPGWMYIQVKQKILDSVDKTPSLQGKVLTGGRLNAYNAVKPTVIYTGPLIQYREAVTGPDGKRRVFFDKAIPQQGTIEQTVAILKRMAAGLKIRFSGKR